jgi:hypothetical protein
MGIPHYVEQSVKEPKDPKTNRLKTLSNLPIGEAQSRATARAAVESIGGAPDIHAQFVSYASVKSGHYDFRRATWNDREWLRREDESLESFETRICDSLPVFGPPKAILWHEQ